MCSTLNGICCDKTTLDSVYWNFPFASGVSGGRQATIQHLTGNSKGVPSIATSRYDISLGFSIRHVSSRGLPVCPRRSQNTQGRQRIPSHSTISLTTSRPAFATKRETSGGQSIPHLWWWSHTYWSIDNRMFMCCRSRQRTGSSLLVSVSVATITKP